MIKSTYPFIYKILIALLFISVTVTILFTSKQTLVFLAENFLKKNNIEYSKAEGTLFNGIILYNVKYKNILSAKRVQINYKLSSLISFKPKIKSIQTDTLLLDVDKIPFNESNETGKLFAFKVIDTKFINSKIIFDKKEYLFDSHIKNLSYDKTFNASKLNLALKSFYANATVVGKIDKNRLSGSSSDVTINELIYEKYLDFMEPLTKKLHVDFTIDEENLAFKTFIHSLTLHANKDVTIRDQNLSIKYMISKNIFLLKDDYNLKYAQYLSYIQQEGTFSPNGKYNFKINSSLSNPPKNFPVKQFDANVSGDAERISIDANASNFVLNAYSTDYNKYTIKLINKNLNPLLVHLLAKNMFYSPLSFQANASLRITPLHMSGLFYLSNNIADISATFSLDKTRAQMHAKIDPNKKNKIFANYNLKLITPLTLEYTYKNKNNNLNINANLLKVSLKEHNNVIEGDGNLGSALFTLNSNLNSATQAIIKTQIDIPSVNKLLRELKLTAKDDETEYDGEVHIASKLNIDNNFSIQSTLSAPWLSLKTDSQNKYMLKDLSIKAAYENKKINIYSYKSSYKNQKVYSDKLSQIHFDKNETMIIDNFYIYDNLLAKGTIRPSTGSVKVNLHSDKFNFNSNDINVTAKADIHINIENTKKQIIDGNITLMNGIISYIPKHDYTITDDDIIIVQEMKKQKNSNLILNVSINATKALKYKTKEIDVDFIPALKVTKQKAEKIKIHGKITIVNGYITAQSKKFEFDKSEFLFLGEDYLNPQLNLKLRYQTLDYKDITILITNRLNAPILIFSSIPVMDQNDIMSYILFDEPADSVFNNSATSSKTSINYLLLGTGIKSIFNQATGITVDTLNILNNTDGTLGYEVGARFNKRVRIIYKNDTSSSMILQYSLAKSVRINVDVHDVGQGIYFIYAKDFK